jgi:hypothetical protein
VLTAGCDRAAVGTADRQHDGRHRGNDQDRRSRGDRSAQAAAQPSELKARHTKIEVPATTQSPRELRCGANRPKRRPARTPDRAQRSHESGLQSVDLVALVLEEAGQNLFEGALPVAEPEAVVWWDRIQLAVGELGDSP